MEAEAAAEAAPVETSEEAVSQAEATPVEDVAEAKRKSLRPRLRRSRKPSRPRPRKKRQKKRLKRPKPKPKSKLLRLQKPKRLWKPLRSSLKPQPPNLFSSKCGSRSATSTRAGASPDRTSSIVATAPRRSHGAPHQPAGEARPVEGQPIEGTPVEGAPQDGARQERRQFDRPRRDDRRSEGGGKPRFEGNRPEGGREPRKFEGKFDGKRRDDQRGERPVPVEKRPPREKQADPDSPFAKLAALKAELEARNKKN